MVGLDAAEGGHALQEPVADLEAEAVEAELVRLPKRPASYDTAEVHRRLKELAVAGDAKAAGKELAGHLSTTLAALHAVVAAACD